MTVKMKEELEVHRMRGPIPFMSGCPHCQKTRGVTQHRRGKDLGNRPVELQADFCFINLVTGTFVKDQPNAPNMKILVMTEMSTRMVGCALVGTNADHTATWIRLDSPEGLTYGVGEHEVPKLASVVNAVLIDKNAAFPEPMK
ncbi:unnamed protein product, partial [Symbiodinium microadriaticum]